MPSMGIRDGLAVFFLGLDALLKNKQASGRDKDISDIRKLKAIARKIEGAGKD